MKLFQVLHMLDPRIDESNCKLHFAGWNGIQNPLDEYFAGRFDDWQSWQNKKNFSREHVVSLIQMPPKDRWLYAGVHKNMGCEEHKNRGRNNDRLMYRYNLKRLQSTDNYCGRIIVAYGRPFRNAYPFAEKCAQDLVVSEIYPERLQFAEFPGFTSTLLTMLHLKSVVEQQISSWRSALASVSGVYVITDQESGKLYVGSAVGDQGIWGRWCAYAKNGHGGNAELKKILNKHGADYAMNFQFGILETADTKATRGEILARESHWKRLLLSRIHGHNAN